MLFVNICLNTIEAVKTKIFFLGFRLITLNKITNNKIKIIIENH